MKISTTSSTQKFDQLMVEDEQEDELLDVEPQSQQVADSSMTDVN